MFLNKPAVKGHHVYCCAKKPAFAGFYKTQLSPLNHSHTKRERCTGLTNLLVFLLERSKL